jgi:hypothetical protein
MVVTGSTGGEKKPNYNIVGDNRIKKVFKIPVGNIPEDEIEDYIKKVAEKFKKATQIQPDLDCGIYPNENELFLPINVEKNIKNKMPEQPDLQKIHNALYPKGSSTRYMRTVPNSHFWTDLEQIKYSIELELQRVKRENSDTVYVGEPLTKKYILIGLCNSIKNGYKLKPTFKEDIRVTHGVIPIFESIEQMIEYVKSEDFTLEMFNVIIIQTLTNKINLTNGLKMRRTEVYGRIDGERDYQDKTWVARRTLEGTPDEEKPVAEWINYIEYHLSKAKERVYHLDTQGALAEVRKVAALAVRTMEIHGCPERIIKEDFKCNCEACREGLTTKEDKIE